MTRWMKWRVCLCLIQITLTLVHAHVRFVCPRPQTPKSDIFEQYPSHPLDGPCGLGSSMEFDREYMEVEPGPLTVVFEETELHADSPFRISLHEFPREEGNDSSSESCVLLDQIPHNNEAVITDHCKVDGYPIGHCDQSKYTINIKIPDIQCDRCYLRLAYVVMDDPSVTSCSWEDKTCKTYYSCANIKIRPSTSGESLNISSCGTYVDNLLGPWPTRPQEIYKVTKQPGESKNLADVNYDPYNRQLQIDVRVKDRDSVQMLAVVQEVTTENGTDTVTLFSHNVTQSDYVVDTVVAVWSGVTSDVETLLKNNSLILSITNKDGDENGTLEFLKGYNSLGHYVPLNGAYSRQGWLLGPHFIGAMADFPSALEPAGTCVGEPYNYVAFLHLYGMVKNFHGVVAMSFMDRRVHITAAVHGLKTPIQSIHGIGPDLGGAPSFFITNNTNGSSVLNLVANAASQMPYLATVRFLKMAIVRSLDMLVDGDLEQGMQCILRVERRVFGVGGFQFTKGKWLIYEVLIKDPDSDIVSVTLDGPASWTVNGAAMFNITDKLENVGNGEWLVKGTLKDLSSKFLLALWKGWIKLSVKTRTITISGKVSPPGIWYCTQVKGAPCSMVNMLPVHTEVIDEGAEVVPAFGLAAFVLDRTDVLQYSILIENLREKASDPLTATLSITYSNVTLSLTLHPSQDRDKAYTSHGILPEPNTETIHALAAGHLLLTIDDPRVGKKPFKNTLPSVTRQLCTDQKDHMIGGSEGWRVGRELHTVYGLVYDKLIFQFADNDSVYLMKNKDNYNNCSFEGATEIGEESSNETRATFTLDKDAHLYFASRLNCNRSLKVMVVSVSGVAPDTADLNDCGDSLFKLWRKQRLSAYTPPNPMGSAIGGIIAGIIILAAFIVWDSRVNRKKSGNLALFERF